MQWQSPVSEDCKLRIDVGWYKNIILTKIVYGISSHQAPEMHETGNVGDGDDNVDHNEKGRDEVGEEEQSGKKHAQLEEGSLCLNF